LAEQLGPKQTDPKQTGLIQIKWFLCYKTWQYLQASLFPDKTIKGKVLFRNMYAAIISTKSFAPHVLYILLLTQQGTGIDSAVLRGQSSRRSLLSRFEIRASPASPN